MRWNFSKKRETRTQETMPDLLAEADEAAFQAAKRPRPVAEEASDTPEVELMAWEEQETTYKPQTIDAARFLAELAPDETPELQPNQPLIFIRKAACDALQAHLRQNLDVELGGLLLGPARYDAQRQIYLLVVEQALPAQDGIETAISFEYTAASWTNLFPQLQRMDSTWTILGSYHSHPGLGVFLSPTDLATQTDVFPHDWQIAVVADPVLNETGFFIGPNGTPCPRPYLLD